MGKRLTVSKIVPSIKNIVREICISSCKGKYPDRDNGKLFFLKSQRGVCECSGNNLNSVKVRGYSQVRANLRRINRDEISDEMDRIVELLNVRNECRYRYAQKKETHSVRAKNADCTCIHSTKNKVQRWSL